MIDRHQFEQRVTENMAKEKRKIRRVFFAVSAFLFSLFFIISMIVILGDPLSRDALARGPLLASLILFGVGWFISVVYQGVGVLLDSGAADSSLRSRVVQQVLSEQVLDLMSDYEKPKRTSHADHPRPNDEASLSEDGEIVSLEELMRAEEARRRAARD
ncbi:MAG: hypothetical protein SNJ59_15390 [Aggregatilineales bacterium]